MKFIPSKTINSSHIAINLFNRLFLMLAAAGSMKCGNSQHFSLSLVQF